MGEFEQKYKISRVGLHHFEEPCLSGERGSGTIFFSGCNLRCVFCQNHQISHGKQGLEINEMQLLDCMRYLQDIGAHNVNLVTPANWATRLAITLEKAKTFLQIPIVWNSSGYETTYILRQLEGLVDVYLPDFKYADDSLAWEYSHARDYKRIAHDAIVEMRRQQPIDVFDNDGIMQKGVIVRHLVLPDATKNSVGVLKEIASIDKNMFVSLMGQYFPTDNVKNHPILSRRITQEEYDAVTDAFFDAGLKNGFSQELSSAIEEYVPDFDLSALEQLLNSFKK